MKDRMEMKMWQKWVLLALEIAAIAAIAYGVWFFLDCAGLAEEAEEPHPVYVTATLLNGRQWPTKKAQAMTFYDYGEQLQPTGKWSKDREWIEIYGGEAGTVWVCARYVTERMTEFTVTNENNGKIRIRSKPGGGKVKGYVKHGKSIEIDRVIMGWGHCSRGWVELDYFIEEV